MKQTSKMTRKANTDQVNKFMKNKNQEPQHTPTPWKVVHELSVEAENGRAIGTFGTQGGIDPQKTIHESMANAAYIVRAANSHEALLEACKRALAVWGKLDGSAQVGNKDKVGDKLSQAIAKAEGL